MPDVIPNVDTGFITTFVELSRTEPDRTFLTFDGVPYTFARIAAEADAFAHWLRSRGAAPGDRVALMMRNSPSVVAMIFGLAKAGVLWVPINPQQRGPGLSYLLAHSDPRVVIVDDELCGRLDESLLPADAQLVPASELNDAVFSNAGHDDRPPFTEAPPSPDELLALMYTSGTTGPPKAVMVTHRMLRIAAEGTLRVSRADDGAVFFVWEALYHVGGAQLLVLPLLRDVRLAMVARFSASTFWRQAAEAGATHIHYLGGILQMLLAQPASDADRSHGVRVAWGGGCPTAVFEAVRRRFGLEIYECYGMTETSSIASVADGSEGGVIGRALPWFDISVRNERDEIVAAGERGEITIGARLDGALFGGYYHDAEATRKALRGGLMRTGDLGSFDHRGVLRFHGRLTENLRCRGENVSAWEVEHVVTEHPLVEEAAVIGVEAEIGEQEIKLFVKPMEGVRLDPAALVAWLQPRLAKYQLPRYVEIVADFEHTPSQRIRKHLLNPSTHGVWDRQQQRSNSASIV
ncbi:MAG: AMP-binding protein [Protaetiibacter sp.]